MLTLSASSLPSRATVIFLHGLGQTNSSWLPWVQELAKHLPSIDWVLPQADTGPVTFPDGRYRPRWFDVHALPPREDEDDRQGAAASRDHIQQVIQDLNDAGLPSENIFLAGFSQGSCMALLSGLTSKHVLGGIVVLSGWLPLKLRYQLVPSTSLQYYPPVFWAHGTADDQIPLQIGLETAQWLRTCFVFEQSKFVFHEYLGMGHHVNDEVLFDLRDWLTKLLQ